MNPESNRFQPTPLPSDTFLAAIIDSSDDAIVSKDLNGTITSWNKGAERIFGYARDEMIGRSILLLLPTDRFHEEEEILSRIRQGRQVDPFDTVRRRKDGSLIDVSVTISPILDPRGRVIGASKIAREIAHDRKLSRNDVLLAAIVSSSDDAIISKNLEGIVLSWNGAAERMFGYTADEMIGQSILALIPRDRHHEEPVIIDRLRRGERIEHYETVRVRKSGQHFPVSLTISPLKDGHGAIVGASKIARDITEIKIRREERERVTREREQLLESERAARAQAEHANRMKDDFLSTVSHELRTPLNAIVGWTEVLSGGEASREEIAHGIEIIKRNALVQAQLIEDLLDLGKISSGKMPLHVEQVDLVRIVRDAVTSVQFAADLKHISIETHLNEIRGGLLGDSKRLQQVVWNLLSNAIKFTPPQGRIEVNLTRNDSHFEIAVTDNGQGIAADFIPHLFQRFRQADASITRKHGGLGIGLALVKELVELHAGRVYAESGGPGQGSTFTVELPVAITHVDERLIAPRAQSPRPTTRAPFADLTGIRVLAVDDDADSLELVKRILTERNAEVVTARDAEEAIAAFREARPDVVLSDIGMPTMDGYALIKVLRELPGGKTVPAAALTALARPEDRTRALTAGYQTHVSKPIVASEMVAVVHSLASLRLR